MKNIPYDASDSPAGWRAPDLSPKDAISGATIKELHEMILMREFDHSDLERGIMARIAAIPRIPVAETRDGRWWPTTNSYPFGN